MQGIKHDLSKYSRVEFWNSVKYYTGTNSPISNEKADKGYSMMWLNHKAKNKHHWEYWTDFKFGTPYAAKMPKRYLVEHVLDSIAAGKTYGGKSFKKENVKKYFEGEPYRLYHEDTKVEIFRLLNGYEANTSKHWFKHLREYLKNDVY